MSAITIAATYLTEANLVRSMSLTTESKTLSNGTEQYRAVMRLTVERDAKDITAVGQPTEELVSRANILCRFNESEPIEIFPLTASGTLYEFKLIGQHFTPKNGRGSQFFNLVQEYTSVTPWATLSWG